jgi:hypothetical protein
MSNSKHGLEELTGVGILIAGEPVKKIISGNECWLNVTAQFSDEGDEELNDSWFRSLFLTCVSKKNQGVASINIIKSRVIFPGDIKKIVAEKPMVSLTLRLNLENELDRKLVEDSYYITISARQFLSNTVLVEVI